MLVPSFFNFQISFESSVDVSVVFEAVAVVIPSLLKAVLC